MRASFEKTWPFIMFQKGGRGKPGTRRGYSQRKNRDEIATQTTVASASAPTSPACAVHGAPVQMPRSSETA